MIDCYIENYITRTILFMINWTFDIQFTFAFEAKSIKTSPQLLNAIIEFTDQMDHVNQLDLNIVF